MNEVHYFASSVFSWIVAETFGECVEKFTETLRQDARGLLKPGAKLSGNVWKVPLPISAEYHIEDYRPTVEGIEHQCKIEIINRSK